VNSSNEGSETPRRRRRGLAHALAAAVALTVLNAVKPLQLDDEVPLYYADQILAHPLDPYDFTITWQQIAESAQNPIAPPVLPYWCAAGTALFGHDPVLWKLWLLPFSLALTLGIWSLARRFARGFEGLTVWAVALSPVVLPGLKLIIEVPSVALGVATVALFARACDRRSVGVAVAAGLLCGLALQTKWTTFVIPAAMLWYAALYRRIPLWLATTAVAAGLFVGWETLMFARSGTSHFMYQVKINNPLSPKQSLLLPLITYVGGLAGGATLIGLAGLGASKRSVAAAAAVIVLGTALIGFNPGSLGGAVRNPLTGKPWQPRIDTPIFLAMGALAWITAAATILSVWRPFHTMTPWRNAASRAGWFLAGWLAMEIVGYFVLSPFGAARRVIMVVLLLILIACRLASLTCRSPGRAWLVRSGAALSVALGLFYQTVDTAEAVAGKNAVEAGAAWAIPAARAEGGRAWFAGYWNAEFYGPRAGLKPLVMGQSDLCPGDRLVIADVQTLEGNRYTIDDSHAVIETVFESRDVLPFSTVPCYYIGRRPLERQEGPRAKARVFRVVAPWHPVQEFDAQGR
jgi:hypothetical protein